MSAFVLLLARGAGSEPFRLEKFTSNAVFFGFRTAWIQIELFLERNGYSQIRITRFFRRMSAFVLVPLWEVDSGGDWVKKIPS